ncbi:MAG: bacteriocin immunity protein [Streptococcaceae bacterium]|nr:bacteriocin immunity protein [Streptococcaceae bacterium]
MMRDKKKRPSLDQALENLQKEMCELIQGDEITQDEREILATAIQEFQKKVYFQKVIADLEGALMPLVVKRESSKAISNLYTKLLSPDFANKGLGGLVAFSAPGIGW